jgi:hypothetical protein
LYDCKVWRRRRRRRFISMLNIRMSRTPIESEPIVENKPGGTNRISFYLKNCVLLTYNFSKENLPFGKHKLLEEGLQAEGVSGMAPPAEPVPLVFENVEHLIDRFNKVWCNCRV